MCAKTKTACGPEIAQQFGCGCSFAPALVSLRQIGLLPACEETIPAGGEGKRSPGRRWISDDLQDRDPEGASVSLLTKVASVGRLTSRQEILLIVYAPRSGWSLWGQRR